MSDLHDDIDTPTHLAPAADRSPLANMRAGLFDGIEEEITEADEDGQHVDLVINRLKLPRFTVFARFAKVPHVRFRKLFDVPDKVKRVRPDWDLHANVDLLIEANVGVYAQLPDGTRIAFNRTDPDGPYPTLADGWAQIAANLPGGDTIGSARQLVLRLYSEGAVITTGNAIAQHSDYDEALLTGN